LIHYRPWLGGTARYPNDIPTMISAEEKRYLHWLGAEVWRDQGHIVEIGPWLGGSTACLASGIRERRQPPVHKLITIDNFVWRPFMADRAALPLSPGDSFESYTRENLADYADLVDIRGVWLRDEQVENDSWADEVRGHEDEADKTYLSWDQGDPVEILFIDGAKSWDGLVHLLGLMAPALTAKALIVFQDYKFWGGYWVPMIAELLGDSLELRHVLPFNSVAFELTAPLDLSLIQHPPAPQPGLDLLSAGAQRLRGQGDRLGSSIVMLEGVRFLAHAGDQEEAGRYLSHVAHDWPLGEPLTTVTAAESWLQSESGKPVPRRGGPRDAVRPVARAVTRVVRRADAFLAPVEG
jgi:hypothetical protein